MSKTIKAIYSLRMDPEHARLLKEIKARDGIPESEQIRRALMNLVREERSRETEPQEVRPKSGTPACWKHANAPNP